VPLPFSLGSLPLCARTVFSGLSALVRPYGRKPLGHTGKDNPEKTVGAHKKGQSRENRSGTQETTIVCLYCFLWIVRPFVPLRFSLDYLPLCAPTVFSGLSVLVYPYGFLWIFRGHTRKANPDKTVVAHKKGQPSKNRRGTLGRTIQRKP
jgi:hypothetical protein